MADTVFAKILRGEIPCHRIYEDAAVLAFLDVNPLSRGHTLVIPKEPAETMDKLSDDAAAAIGRVLPRIARAVVAATGATAYNVLQNNGPMAHQAVLHVHFHIIPKYDDGSGLGIGWKATKLEGGAELATSCAVKLVGPAPPSRSRSRCWPRVAALPCTSSTSRRPATASLTCSRARSRSTRSSMTRIPRRASRCCSPRFRRSSCTAG